MWKRLAVVVFDIAKDPRKFLPPFHESAILLQDLVCR
jgi:hypothetical protein